MRTAMRTSKFILYFILLTFLFISCQQVTDPVSSNDSNKLKPTDQEIQYQTNAILAGTFRLTGEFLTDYDQNASGGTESISTEGDRSHSYQNGTHTWKGTLTNPSYPDAYYGEYIAKLQYQDANGNVVSSARNAVSMSAYGDVWAEFGFVAPDPDQGDRTEHLIQGTWTHLRVTPIFNGSGKYERTWTGIYNNNKTTFHNVYKIQVNNLYFYHRNKGYSLVGTIIISMDQYRAVVTCNGSSKAKVIVYENGKFKNKFNSDIPDLYKFTFGGLILPR